MLREIERALQHEDKEKRSVLFPVRIDDYIFEEWSHPRKADVTAKVVGDFRDFKEYEKSFRKLVESLNKTCEKCVFPEAIRRVRVTGQQRD